MFGLSIACLVVGAGGVYLAARFLPPLAQTQEGVIATWVVRVFFGVAVAWAALQIYFMIYAYANVHREASFPLGGNDKTEILTTTVQTILLYGGLLIVAASVIYLLAPTEEIAATAPSVGEQAPSTATNAST